MIYFQDTLDFHLDRPSAVTLGKFDGVHLGHQKLIDQIKKHDGLISTMFVLNAKKEALIYTETELKEIAKSLGIQALIICPFIPQISGMKPEEFIRVVLKEKLKADYIAIGTDFRFGYHRSGDADTLKQAGIDYHMAVDVVEKKTFADRDISSTYIREALGRGDMKLAEELLGRPYTVSGTVLHGRQIGRTLGMPTVNLVPGKEKLLPPNGVYLTKTLIDDQWYPGVTNIGDKPTVGESFVGVETYLFGINRDLYGKSIVTAFFQYKRPEKKFSSLFDLKEQMSRDIEYGRAYFGR